MLEKIFAAACVAAVLGLAGPASALTASVDAFDNGWYDSTGHNPSNTNTLTGDCCASGEHRSFYAFDLTPMAGRTVLSATIVFLAGNGEYFSDDPFEDLGLFDVTTPVATLVAGGSAAPFADLGTGASYGTARVGSGAGRYAMPEVSVTLTAAALGDVNALLSGASFDFAIGAALTALSGGQNEESLWSNSNGVPAARLILSTDAPAQVPLPAALPLLAAAIGGFGLIAGRRGRGRRA